MRTSEMIKSKFWRAGDLQGQAPVVLTIADVTEEIMGRGGRPETKCFLWFQEHLKGLQLNKTRVRVLEAAYGPDSERWVGKRVRLSFDPTVDFGGRAVGGVRLQTPPGVVYVPNPAISGDVWGGPLQGPAGRPPQPVWDEASRSWQVPPGSPAPVSEPHRPPPPVWNPTTQTWDTVNPATGEISPPARAPTISERVNAVHPPAAAEFDDDIPF